MSEKQKILPEIPEHLGEDFEHRLEFQNPIEARLAMGLSVSQVVEVPDEQPAEAVRVTRTEAPELAPRPPRKHRARRLSTRSQLFAQHEPASEWNLK